MKKLVVHMDVKKEVIVDIEEDTTDDEIDELAWEIAIDEMLVSWEIREN